MQHKALEKKSNIEYLEQVGWQQFLPKFVIEGIPVCVVNFHLCRPYVCQSVNAPASFNSRFPDERGSISH